MKYSAIAFDLDGTLYPDIRLFVRLVPFFLKEMNLLRALNEARMHLRNTGAYEGDFYETQARLMGEILNQSPERVKEKTERLIYRGWEPFFKEIKLFPHVRETLDCFRQKGIKMGLLSDFPPEKKLENLRIAGYWDAVVCSEKTGRLKPDTLPFIELAGEMGAAPEEILYVGNSVRYDVMGARKTGMKTALIRTGIFERIFKPSSLPDFTFFDYRQLRDYVLD